MTGRKEWESEGVSVATDDASCNFCPASVRPLRQEVRESFAPGAEGLHIIIHAQKYIVFFIGGNKTAQNI